MFTRKHLRKWWSKALRRRVLFTALDDEDRGYLYLTMRAFDEVRSAEVGRIIVKILARLRDALMSPFVRRMETYGIERVKMLSAKAVEWGSGAARNLPRDAGFVMYLTALHFNAPSGWGV